MPASLVSSLIGWAASHLVSLTLLGFLLVGLALLGVVPVPRDWVAPPATQVKSSAPPAAAGTSPSATDGPAPAGGEQWPPVSTMPSLTGDSPPVHPASGPQSVTQRPIGAQGEGGFRPSSLATGNDTPGLARDDLVQVARRAFWNGDLEAAEAAYIDLISAYPDDADGFGELGNLYRSMGNPAAARDAYFEAALRLKATGENQKLQPIIDLLTEEGDPRAAQLGR